MRVIDINIDTNIWLGMEFTLILDLDCGGIDTNIWLGI